MATYRDMNTYPDPAIEHNFVASGYVDEKFTLAVGPIRIELTKEEKERTLDTWSKLEAGIDPETNEPFTKEKMDWMIKNGIRKS